MDKKEFSQIRTELNKTQKQLAELLGTSLKAIHSYEQGWRNIPPAVERQLLFLLSRKRGNLQQQACWDIKNCPSNLKERCPAWEFQVGTLCWFIGGTICEGTAQKNWKDKIAICRLCKVFANRFSMED